MKKKIFILILILFYPASNAMPVVFSTWNILEADKLASIWLIKRFISPGAEIIFYKKGVIPDRGIQFDTPYSKIRRKFNQSTFESLVNKYHITDPKLLYMAKLIHDIEINIWGEKKFKRTRKMKIFFMDLLNSSKKNKKIIQKSDIFFDKLYRDLPDNLNPGLKKIKK